MALKKPAFETTNETAPFADATVVEAPAQTAPVEQAKVEATTAIAKAATTAVAVSNDADIKAFQAEFDSMQGAADFSYGNYDIYKASSGEIREMAAGSKVTLGRWAKVRLLGWQFNWQVSPGVDGAQGKDFVAYSDDGQTISSVIGEDNRHYVGKSVNDYLDYLRAEGFAKAECKKYLNTACAVLEAESGKNEPGQVVQVVLSPSSIPSFNSYQERLKTLARGAKLGLPGFTLPTDPFTFKFEVESVSRGSQRWDKLRIVAAA